MKKIIGKLPIHSLVVFVQNNTYHINANNVIPLSALKSNLLSGEAVLTVEQMEKAYNLLLASKTEMSTKEHIGNIRTQQENIEHGICPRCGGKLVLRNGMYGEFWGCSNYPKCKFIKKTGIKAEIECETELSPDEAASYCKGLFKKTPEGGILYFSIQPDGFFG